MAKRTLKRSFRFRRRVQKKWKATRTSHFSLVCDSMRPPSESDRSNESSPCYPQELRLPTCKSCLHSYSCRAATRSRTSSISSRLGRLSISGLTSLPSQSTPQQPQASNSTERPSNDLQHEHTRPHTSPVLEHQDPTSLTRKRGPGVPRNPVSDTWRDDAYTKKDSGKGKMVDVAKRQDRWRCEYCGRYNERGIAKDTSGTKIEGVDENALVGVPGPSRP